MKQERLSVLSLEQLEQKKKNYISLLTAFAVLLGMLIVLTSFMYFTSGLTPLLIIPFGIFPLFAIGCRRLRYIYKEIEFRLVSSSRFE